MAEDSIELDCDACGRLFTVTRDGDRASCPSCGDVNRIPAEPGSTRRGEETDLRTVRPALVRGHPVASAASGGLVLAGLVAAILANTSDWPSWSGWIGGVGMLVGGGWMLWLFVLGHRWDRLRITTHRCIDERGIVMRSTSEVLHSHVRNLRITQSIWQRIVGIGDVEIDSAAGDGQADITIRNVPDPDGIKRLVDRHRGLGAGD